MQAMPNTYDDPDTWVAKSPNLRATSRIDGKNYGLMEYLQSIDQRVVDVQTRLISIEKAVTDTQNRIRGPKNRDWDQLQELVARLKGPAPDDDRLGDMWDKLTEILTALNRDHPSS